MVDFFLNAPDWFLSLPIAYQSGAAMLALIAVATYIGGWNAPTYRR